MNSDIIYLSNLDLAVQLNNAGCYAVESMKLDAAAATLRDGLDALSRPPVTLRHHRDDDDAATDADSLEEYLAYRAELIGRAQERLSLAAAERSDTASPTSTSPSMQSHQVHRGGGQRQAELNDEDCSPLVYSTPLSLEPLEDNSAHPRGSLEAISAAVLFNLSLVAHLQGERLGSRAHIDRAIQFYKLTERMVIRAKRQLHQDGSGEEGSYYDDSDRFLRTVVMGVMNNAGQICVRWLGRPDEGREYFSRLTSMAIGASEGVEGLSPSPLAAPRSMLGMLAFNTMVTHGKNAAGAA